jgi:hypothetical protein
MSDKAQPKEWVAPLVRAMLSAPTVPKTVGPVICPICGCEHQTFQGTGCFCPNKDNTALVCAFPTTELLVKVELPKDIKIGGTVTYVRYACECGNHRWALLTAFHKSQTVVWCVDLTPYNKMNCKHGKKAKQQSYNPIVNSIQQLLQGVKASGVAPVVMLGPGITGQLPPQVIEQLQAQGIQFPSLLPSQQLPPPNLAPESMANQINDHENPLNRLPPTLPTIFKNWDSGPVTVKSFAKTLPKLPTRNPLRKGPPHIVTGDKDLAAVNAKKDWLFALAVELPVEFKNLIHTLVYWDTLLIVVNDNLARRDELARKVTDAITAIGKFKPDIYMMPRRNYDTLRQVKEKAAIKLKS